MKKVFVSLFLVVSLACASAQKTEFQTVSAAVAGVEAARSAYYDLDHTCLANPAAMPSCPGIVAAHDSLAKKYLTYQAAVKALADANIAVIQTGGNPTTDGKVAAAAAGLLQVATDFVTLEGTVGVKK